MTQPCWKPNLVAGTLRCLGGGESKYSMEGSHKLLPLKMLSGISSPDLLLDLHNSSLAKTCEKFCWLLAVFLGRDVPQAVSQGVPSLSHHTQQGKATAVAHGSTASKAQLWEGVPVKVPSSCGTSLITLLLSRGVFTLSGFVCFPWAPLGKRLAAAYY